MSFPIVLGVDFHEILLVGEMFPFCLLMRIVQDLIHQLGGTGDVEDVLQLVQTLFRDLTQSARAVAVEVGTHAGVHIFQILVDSLADRTEFLVRLIVEGAWIDAIAVV